MLEPRYSTRFKKDLKKFQFNKQILKEFNEILKILLAKLQLSEKYLDHPLSGNYRIIESVILSLIFLFIG